MAKVTNPLMSLSATGALAGQIIFAGLHSGTRAYALRQAKVTGAPARKQRYRDGCTAWQALSPQDKSTWTTTGQYDRLNGFQAFMRNWLNTWAPTAGTTWDGGLTTWDGGLTIFD